MQALEQRDAELASAQSAIVSGQEVIDALREESNSRIRDLETEIAALQQDVEDLRGQLDAIKHDSDVAAQTRARVLEGAKHGIADAQALCEALQGRLKVVQDDRRLQTERELEALQQQVRVIHDGDVCCHRPSTDTLTWSARWLGPSGYLNHMSACSCSHTCRLHLCNNRH